eukprot:1686524-Amphidinium_carterae.1
MQDKGRSINPKPSPTVLCLSTAAFIVKSSCGKWHFGETSGLQFLSAWVGWHERNKDNRFGFACLPTTTDQSLQTVPQTRTPHPTIAARTMVPRVRSGII